MTTTNAAAGCIAMAIAIAGVSAVGCGGARGDAEADETADDSSLALVAKMPAKVTAIAEKNWSASVAPGSGADDGDILALRLYTGDGSYVRRRCYGADCAQAVAETDRFTAFTAKGKTYLQFHSFTREVVPAPPTPPGGKPRGPEVQDHDVVADTYELRTSGSSIKLRKTYSSRWVKLTAVDDADLCASSGGSWDEQPAMPTPQPVKVPPTTKGQQPAAPAPAPATSANAPATPPPAPTYACRCSAGDQWYVPGAGGCMHVAVSSETACDDTNGSYTDDDATRLGTYCQCGLGRTMTDTGCVDL